MTGRPRITIHSGLPVLQAVVGEHDASPKRLRDALAVAVLRLQELEQYRPLIEAAGDLVNNALAEEARAHQE